MNSFQRIFAAARLSFATLVFYLGFASNLLAAKGDSEAADAGGPSWVTGYMFVVLCVAAGMIAILRPSLRRDRARPESFVETTAEPKKK